MRVDGVQVRRSSGGVSGVWLGIALALVAAPLIVGCAVRPPEAQPSFARDASRCWREVVHRSSLDGTAIAQFRMREDLFQQCMQARGRRTEIGE